MTSLGRRCLARLLPSIYVEASKDKIGEGFKEKSEGCAKFRMPAGGPMKAAKDVGEEYYDPAREDRIREKQDKISILGRAP